MPYGKQRLVEIALALATKPQGILLLDEPAAGIPQAESRELFEVIAQLPRDVIVFIEHDMGLVFRFAERITVLVGGKVLTEGTPRRSPPTRASRKSIWGRPNMLNCWHSTGQRRLRRIDRAGRCVLRDERGRQPGPAGPQRRRQDHAAGDADGPDPAAQGAIRWRGADLARVPTMEALARRPGLGAAGAPHVPLADGGRASERGRPAGPEWNLDKVSTACSRACWSGAATWATSCPAANSRWWRSPAP
jgi:hypothetical protein